MVDTVERDRNGRWQTAGLPPRLFNKVFDKIKQAQRKNRRGGKHTLTPAMMKNRDLEKFLKLGKKQGDEYFTIEDMKKFIEQRKAHRKNFSSDVPGITWSEMGAKSKKIDVDRASNRVDDGTGIKKAMFIGLKHNMALVKVVASDASVHQNHQVRIRFEAWDTAVDDAGDEKADVKRLARMLCADRVSIDCDCGRHQYWYRYMATAGNYCVSPPKEYAYPKIRNPDLSGVACKHVLHALNRFQSAAWQLQIAQQLKNDAKRVGYGDDARRTTKWFDPSEQTTMNRNRRGQIDHKKIKEEYRKYKRDQEGFAKSLKKNQPDVESLRAQLTKSRKQSNAQKRALKESKDRETTLQRERDEARQLVGDQLKMKKAAFVDAVRMSGKSKEEAETMFKRWLEKQINGGG